MPALPDNPSNARRHITSWIQSSDSEFELELCCLVSVVSRSCLSSFVFGNTRCRTWAVTGCRCRYGWRRSCGSGFINCVRMFAQFVNIIAQTWTFVMAMPMPRPPGLSLSHSPSPSPGPCVRLPKPAADRVGDRDRDTSSSTMLQTVWLSDLWFMNSLEYFMHILMRCGAQWNERGKGTKHVSVS